MNPSETTPTPEQLREWELYAKEAEEDTTRDLWEIAAQACVEAVPVLLTALCRAEGENERLRQACEKEVKNLAKDVYLCETKDECSSRCSQLRERENSLRLALARTTPEAETEAG